MSNLNIKSPEIDNDGYCFDCRINHNCINCSVMDNLIYYNNLSLKVISSDKKSKESSEIRYCGCGNKLNGKYRMCSQCYFKAKMSGEL